MKTNFLIFLGISICLSTFLYCSPKDKKTETIETKEQKDSLQFDFDAYLNKQHYEALDSGKSLIVVQPNAAFFALRFKHLRISTNFAGSDTTILDSLIVVRFSKINDKWKKTSVRSYIVDGYPLTYTPFQLQQMDFQEPPFHSQLFFYEDINGDGVRDILLTIRGWQGSENMQHNEYKLCYLQHLDKPYFVYVEGFESLGNPEYDSKKKQLYVKEIYSSRKTEETYTWKGDSLVFQKGHEWTSSKYGERSNDYFTKNMDNASVDKNFIVEKFEQNGVQCVYINTKSKENDVNYLNYVMISLPNEPNRTIVFEPTDPIKFYDWNKDGFKDIVRGDTLKSYSVYLFDKESNDFILQ